MKKAFIRWSLPAGRLMILVMIMGAVTGTGTVARAEDQDQYDKIQYKNITLTPGGFIEATGIYRSANENADVGSTYRDIPLTSTTNAELSEFRMTSRQTRLSLLAEAALGDSKASAYYETDFLGAATTANSVESNSWNLRLRQAWFTDDFSNGLSVTVGQAWSLITTYRRGLAPRSEMVPYTIDAQYVVGFNWARQMGVRVTQKFADGFWGAISIENPDINSYGNGVSSSGALLSGAGTPSGLISSGNTGSPNSLINPNTVSTDLAPDLLGKLAFEPGWGHWELKGIGRAFRDRFYNTTTKVGSNNTAYGAGFGAGVILPVASSLNVVAEGLAGSGIGRYAAGVGPDATLYSDGTIHPVRGTQIMGGLEWKPGSQWNIYTYYGAERYERSVDPANSKDGYGGPGNALNTCSTELGSTGNGGCTGGVNKIVSQIQPGFWYNFYKGKEGTAAFGASYSYTNRILWEDSKGDQPSGYENIVMVSSRYYFP